MHMGTKSLRVSAQRRSKTEVIGATKQMSLLLTADEVKREEHLPQDPLDNAHRKIVHQPVVQIGGMRNTTCPDDSRRHTKAA
jgi:predicted RNA-binding protein Jag|mmetsp:Transcript_39924/g.66376  ORF Transcript_39924/g.66376 Transcript_39924/m.66376 type:complete len:82 (-) Transcript_39924:3093-3338(-)